MPQPKKGPRLGAGPKHQNLMLRNMARSLFEYERLQTTEAKARMLRPFAEKLITKAKKGSLHHRRLVQSELEDREIVAKLFEDIGPRFSDRKGGYTRVLKIGPRHGDAAPMALIELVDEGVETLPAEEETSTRRRLPRRRRAAETEATTDEVEPEAAAEPEPTAEAEADEVETQAEETEETLPDAADEPEAGDRGEAPGDARSETSQDEPDEADEKDR